MTRHLVFLFFSRMVTPGAADENRSRQDGRRVEDMLAVARSILPFSFFFLHADLRWAFQAEHGRKQQLDNRRGSWSGASSTSVLLLFSRADRGLADGKPGKKIGTQRWLREL